MTRVPSQSWVKLTLGAALKSPAGPATPGRVQDYTLKAEPALFVWGFDCTATCDPDNRNPVAFHTPVRVSEFAKSLRVTDVTTGTPTTVPVPEPSTQTTWGRDSSAYLTLEDARLQLATAREHVPRGDWCGADVGRWPDSRLHVGGPGQNWHRTAFTSFGDGHGVWEASGGSVLPFYSRNLFGREAVGVAPQPDDLMPTIRALTPTFGIRPPVDPVEPQAQRDQRSHSVARSRRREGAGRERDRSRVGGGRERRVDSQCEALGAARCARRSCR